MPVVVSCAHALGDALASPGRSAAAGGGVVPWPGLANDFQRRGGWRDRPREWVLNAQVAASYSRMDPAAHAAELAGGLGLGGEGVALLTAASVADMVQCEDDGAHAAATAGLRIPAWAAAPPGTADRKLAPAWRPGTINIIVSVPVPLSAAAYVNAVMTATEAKTQAVLEAGFHATGTASDAICVAGPGGGSAPGLRRAAVAVGRPDRPRGARRATLPGNVQPGIGLLRRLVPEIAGTGCSMSRCPHNPEVAGSNPAPATK